jgi:hypothetical protein
MIKLKMLGVLCFDHEGVICLKILIYPYKEIKVETNYLEKYSETYGSIKKYIKDNYLHLIDSKSEQGEIKLLPRI